MKNIYEDRLWDVVLIESIRNRFPLHIIYRNMDGRDYYPFTRDLIWKNMMSDIAKDMITEYKGVVLSESILKRAIISMCRMESYPRDRIKFVEHGLRVLILIYMVRGESFLKEEV